MKTYADTIPENKSQAAAHSLPKHNKDKSAYLMDNRAGAIVQPKLQKVLKGFPLSQPASYEVNADSGNVVQLVSTKDRLNGFKSKTDAGFFEFRPGQVKAMDAHIQALAATLENGEPESQDKVNEILELVIAAENLLESKTRTSLKTEASNKRLALFQIWKRELVDNLDNGLIKGNVTDFVGSRQNATQEHQQEPLNIGVDGEGTGMGGLKSNKYGAINGGLRKDTEDNIALYEGYRALKHYDQKQGNWMMGDTGKYHDVGVKTRYGNTLLGGVLPQNANVGEEYLEKGFAFFGSNAHNGYGEFKMRVNLTKVMTIQSNMYGEAEKDKEYISAPGARFRYDSNVDNVYNFTQTA